MPTLAKKSFHKKSALDLLISSCALGLLWAWFLCAGNIGPQTFGLETPYSVIIRSIISFSLMLAMFLFGSERLSICFPYRQQVLFGVIGCAVSTCFFWALKLLDYNSIFLFLIFGFLTSISYSILLHAWITKNILKDFFQLFARVMLASIIMILLYIVLLFGPLTTIAWCAIVIPLALAKVFLDALPTCFDTGSKPGTLQNQSKRKSPLLASLFLSTFASGLLVTSWIQPHVINWAFAVIPLGIIIFLLSFFLKNKITPYGAFASLSAFICIVIIVVLIFPSSASLFSSLIFAGFWLLFAFALATATWCGAQAEERASQIASKYMGYVVTALFFSRLVGTFFIMEDTAYLVIVAVLLAFSLALALAKGSHLSLGKEARKTSFSEASFNSSEQCKKIATMGDLTEREYDVFCLLAKGYSLKSISEKLYVSGNTVKSHRRRIYLKLDINSRQELIDLVEADHAQAEAFLQN